MEEALRVRYYKRLWLLYRVPKESGILAIKLKPKYQSSFLVIEMERPIFAEFTDILFKIAVDFSF